MSKLRPMSESAGFNDLLEATIEHVQRLKSQGTRYVPVDRATLEALARPAPRARVAPPPVSSAATPGASATATATAPATPNPSAAVAGPGIGTVADQVEKALDPESSSALSALRGEAKARAMEDLRERALVCAKCVHLAASRTHVVFGVGNIEADLMFVGEAPGADEDAKGEPFVGKAGELLTRIIQTMGLERGDVYIANILKCRPDTPGQRSGNRKPTAEEMQTCIPYLHEQIDLIRPKALVALGATAVEGLLGKTQGITRLRGNWRTYRGIPLMPTYHPAFLLRNQSNAEKRKVWEDMLLVMETLSMPISEKQRGYFLKAT